MNILESLSAIFLIVGLVFGLGCLLEKIVNAKLWKRRNMTHVYRDYPARWRSNG